MAALIKHGLSKNNLNEINSLLIKTSIIPYRNYAKKIKQKLRKVEVPACRTLQSTEDSLSSKGFLRCYKNYEPPADLGKRLEDIFRNVLGSQADRTEPILNPSLRYSLFAACYDEFKHGIPNSILHLIRTYADLQEFYQTPVNSTLPLEKMKKADLPPNLHIQYEPLRFLPEEDTMFNGQTAFPQSNTLVTGLRTRRKFKGHKVTETWNVY
ncbi:large ribosomal subunit protein mL50 [Halyomorpha halys]|uniref:large ribosomal subunit protein mL50 n=1 Tax=Halyomorpha halys TaxID=286706 RepID=UPI0006D52586|nr:39S ribosomal protein L50, mitochondrial [Halyomorpha halys]